ncbi:hypothetical protein BDZ94DRAFT_1243491 [Collybia nuda]|uniref:Uncharacterized protein n=1 Tax=Collybia nuda TaxID=64659 RepID=A0A9P5YHB0_9AGAR|nr:hypothetical protein BDZ94DRAFT_1243491 [Collybia nuda]
MERICARIRPIRPIIIILVLPILRLPTQAFPNKRYMLLLLEDHPYDKHIAPVTHNHNRTRTLSRIHTLKDNPKASLNTHSRDIGPSSRRIHHQQHL